MKYYTETTNRKYRPTILHPIGMFCLAWMDPHEYLLCKKDGESWLTSGFPMLEETKVMGGKTIHRPEDLVQYYDNYEDAKVRLDTMRPEWREAYTIMEVTENGLVEANI